jgi:hypothetical protein
MSESAKTLSLVTVAVVLLAAAFTTRMSAPSATPADAIGKTLFPELDEPSKAKRMRIVTFDEGTSRAKEFEVAQANGVWSLPSHKNYPADAKDQLAAAAASLVDLKPLGTASTSARDHELYGVVEPKPAEDQLGNSGVGKLVVFEDGAKKPLARLIIGKEDKSASKADDMGGGQTELRFVRVQGQDPVYRVALKTNKFSTKFADWIETDLLKLNPWDIADIKLRDYSVTDAMSQSGAYSPVLNKRADIDLTFDDKTSKWNLKELLEYKGKAAQEAKLADDEELNTVKLNDLKNALGSLKIMDVARKPEKMSANLKADKDFTNDIDVLRDLVRRGFLPVPVGDDQVEIVSNDGEVTVQMKDGVEYVLRFGAVAGIDMGSDDDKKKDDSKAEDKTAGKTDEEKAADDKSGDKKDSDKKDKGGLSRYIMVMARFNDKLLPKPELEPLPELKKPAAKTDEAKADAKKGDAKSAKGDAKSSKGDDKKGTAAKDAKSDAKADAKKGGEAADAKSTDAKADDAATEEDQEALEARRDKIEKDNIRKQEAFDDKVKAGQQKAKELNSRFADWYYVVGDETYRKIHLNKSDIVKKKNAADASAPGGRPIPPNPFQQLPGGLPGAGN